MKEMAKEIYPALSAEELDLAGLKTWGEIFGALDLEAMRKFLWLFAETFKEDKGHASMSAWLNKTRISHVSVLFRGSAERRKELIDDDKKLAEFIIINEKFMQRVAFNMTVNDKKELSKTEVDAIRQDINLLGTIAEDLSKDNLEYRAKLFQVNLMRVLAEHPDKKFVLAIDTDIGKEQHAQIMPIHKAIDEIKDLKNAKGDPLFPNLVFVRENGDDLVREINKHTTDYGNVFVVAQQTNLEAKKFAALQGQAWIAAIDDAKADKFNYLPVFETATLAIMAALNADKESIKRFYDSLSDKPIDPIVLDDMLVKRVIYILPKTLPIDPNDLKQLYESVKTIYLSA